MDPWISRVDLGDKLGLDLTTSDKAIICVDAACDTIRFITGQDINYTADDTITLDGTGTDTLVLPQRPVTAVGGTILEGTGTLLLANDDYALGDQGVLYRKPGTIDAGWGTPVLRTYWWPGRQNITVTYSHGYQAVPSSIRGVALELAARLFQQEPGLVFEQLGQRQKRWDTAANELTTTEKLVLESVKR